MVAAVSQGQLTASEVAWLNTLRQDLRTVPTVVRVTDLGRSGDGKAEQLQVLSDVGQGDQTGVTNLVNDLRSTIRELGRRRGCRCTWRGRSHPGRPAEEIGVDR